MLKSTVQLVARHYEQSAYRVVDEERDEWDCDIVGIRALIILFNDLS